jgi:glycosyltransferase involved in cell wall biosynthesis
MPKITALLHTHNDAQRIGRALDSLRAADEVIVIDHGSTDDTRKIAGKHGVNVKEGVPGVTPGAYVIDARHDWILCLMPNEALSDALEAALLEWKDNDPEENAASGFSIPVREETEAGWQSHPPATRLVNRKLINWSDELPENRPESAPLAGELLRFNNP